MLKCRQTPWYVRLFFFVLFASLIHLLFVQFMWFVILLRATSGFRRYFSMQPRMFGVYILNVAAARDVEIPKQQLLSCVRFVCFILVIVKYIRVRDSIWIHLLRFTALVHKFWYVRLFLRLAFHFRFILSLCIQKKQKCIERRFSQMHSPIL